MTIITETIPSPAIQVAAQPITVQLYQNTTTVTVTQPEQATVVVDPPYSAITVKTADSKVLVSVPNQAIFTMPISIMRGADGAGVPPGGLTGQVLTKASNDDQDVEWTTLPSPDLSGLVPYVGATANVNLGEYSLVAANISGTNTGDQWPAGVYSEPTYTQSFEAAIIGTGTYYLYHNSTFSPPTTRCVVEGDTLPLVNYAINYIIVSYNAGSPILSVTQDKTVINQSDVILVMSILMEDGRQTVLYRGPYTKGLPDKLLERTRNTNEIGYESGLELSIVSLEGVDNVVSVTEGVVWNGVTRTELAQFNSSDYLYTPTLPMMVFYAHYNGVWTAYQEIPQYVDGIYDDGTNIAELSAGRYSVNWYWQNASSKKGLFGIMGSGDYTYAEALASKPPLNLPEPIKQFGILIGRAICLSGNPTVALVEQLRPCDERTSSFVTDHANLDNLDFASSGHTGFQASIGFTPENVANKATAFQETPDDTHYPSEKLVKDALDAKQSYHSAGVYALPSFIDNNDGTITVGSGEYVLYSDANFNYPLAKYAIAGGTFTLTANVNNYVVADYNGGTPVVRCSTSRDDINQGNVIPIFTVFLSGTTAYKLSWDTASKGLVNRLSDRLVRTQRFVIEPEGVVLGETATPTSRTVTITEGYAWYDGIRKHLPAFNSSTKSLYYLKHSGGNWTQTTASVYDNTEYDDGTNTVTLSANRYAVNWIFVGMLDAANVYVMLGRGDYKLDQAIASLAPSDMPAVFASQALLVGRIIVKNGDNVATAIDRYSLATAMTQSPITDHSALSNLDYANAGHTGFVPEAPVDGTQYARKDAGWVEVASGFSDAPSDGKTYGRKDAGWSEVVVSTPFADTLDQTGWVDNDNIGVAYDSSARTVTLTHPSGTLTYYWRGVKKTLASPWTSTPHTNDAASYYLSSLDGASFTWSGSGFDYKTIQVFMRPNGMPFGHREVHGVMQYATHDDLHHNIGTYVDSGLTLDPTSYTLQPANPTNTTNTPAWFSGVLQDEDCWTSIAATPKANYTQLYFTGAGVATFAASATALFRAGINYPKYNPVSGSTFSEVEAASNQYLCYYAMHVPVTTDAGSQAYRTLILQPQATYTTLAAAQAEDSRTLNLGNISADLPEFVIYARIILHTLSSYNSATGKCRIEDVKYLSGSRRTQVSITSTYITAENVAFTPTATNAATNVQSAIAIIDSGLHGDITNTFDSSQQLTTSVVDGKTYTFTWSAGVCTGYTDGTNTYTLTFDAYGNLLTRSKV